MANYFARKTGNINATDVWATTPSGTAGAQTFVAGDVLYANSFTITINVDTNLGSTGELRNDNTNGATAGGGFTASTSITVTANIFAGSTSATCLTFSGPSLLTLTVNGNLTAGSANNAYAIQNSSSGTVTITGNLTGGTIGSSHCVNNNSSGTINVTGNVVGGVSGNGINNNSTGTVNITGNVTAASGLGISNVSVGSVNITGNVTGGTANNSFGLSNTSSGTVTITGNSTGGTGTTSSGVLNSGSGSLTINGTATGGANGAGANNSSSGTMTVTRAKGNGFGIGTSGSTVQVGVNGAQASFTYVREFEFGDLGASPTSGNIMLTDSTSNVCVCYRYNTTKKTLTDPAATVDFPANSDVRSGTVFANGSRTGTCAVPAAGSVALGVAVGSGTGTAVLTPAAVWDQATSAITASNSIGVRLKNSASVQAFGQALADVASDV